MLDVFNDVVMSQDVVRVNAIFVSINLLAEITALANIYVDMIIG